MSQGLLKLLACSRGEASGVVSNGRSTPPLASDIEYPIGSNDELVNLETQITENAELKAMLVSDFVSFRSVFFDILLVVQALFALLLMLNVLQVDFLVRHVDRRSVVSSVRGVVSALIMDTVVNLYNMEGRGNKDSFRRTLPTLYGLIIGMFVVVL